MKKIMFNDRYGLTEAVLSGRKTQTRRVVSESLWDKWTEYDDFCGSVGVRGLSEIGVAVTREYSDCEKFFLDNSPFKVGEVVAVAQSYYDIDLSTFVFACIDKGMSKKDFADIVTNSRGCTNKMFVRADLMPHQIRITDVRVERLQDISDEDCMAEGVYILDEDPMNPQAYIYTFPNSPEVYYHPREAYAALIDKISGKGTFESNPYVFIYEFELIK